jgi:hypothetical protein
MMQLKWIAVSVLGLAIATACGGDDVVSPTEQTFTASLTGAKERPTPNSSTGTGTATFTLSADGNTLTWNITMANTNNVVASHIHVGGTEIAGPIILPLYGAAKSNNPAISGTITRATFVPPASPLGLSFDALISLMRSGDSYANVHTDDGVAPSNTGPGDFPGGEIRGQITLSP